MSIINSGVGVILLYQALHLSQLWAALGSNLILLQQYIEGVANTHCVLHRPIHRRCPTIHRRRWPIQRPIHRGVQQYRRCSGQLGSCHYPGVYWECCRYVAEQLETLGGLSWVNTKQAAPGGGSLCGKVYTSSPDYHIDPDSFTAWERWSI